MPRVADNYQNVLYCGFMCCFLYTIIEHYVESRNLVEFNQSEKRKRKSVENKVQDSKSVKPLKIIDMNIDCLEEVMEYLNLPDLLEIADSNKRLRRAACYFFSQKYAKKHFEIRTYRNEEESRKVFNVNNNYITITNTETSLKFLRCFGSLITLLTIRNENCNERCCTEILRYINTYCAKSLVTLSVKIYRKSIFDEIHNVFENVLIVSIESSVLKFNKVMLGEIFPKMKHLKLWANDIKDSMFIETKFPKLEHFNYHPNRNDSSNLEKQNLEMFVCLNPQLETMGLDDYWNPDFISHISKHLHRLVKINVTIPESISNFRYIDVSQFKLKSVKKFHIFLWEYDLFRKFAPSFEQLEDFRADGISSNDLQKFVEKNQTIIKLTIRNCFRNVNLNEENVFDVAKVLPLLSDLDVSDANRNGFTTNGAIRFMTKLKTLNKFKFKLDQIDTSNFLTQTAKEWKAINIFPLATTCYITLERSHG